MAVITIDKSDLDELVKEKVFQLLKNREDILEILEEIAFGKMMEEGDTGKYVNENKIMELLGK
ncbi:MAG TPA: hypothetical protein DHW82_10790 [Spirochaetia bacterium]|nr:MAG: hypothetical protein A2Y41_13310 [Spirochaetes bacterium GWB1_36_13]HCL57479.1 hypothetical protein [Spirochaetia bacterium]